MAKLLPKKTENPPLTTFFLDKFLVNTCPPALKPPVNDDTPPLLPTSLGLFRVRKHELVDLLLSLGLVPDPTSESSVVQFGVHETLNPASLSSVGYERVGVDSGRPLKGPPVEAGPPIIKF